MITLFFLDTMSHVRDALDCGQLRISTLLRLEMAARPRHQEIFY